MRFGEPAPTIEEVVITCSSGDMFTLITALPEAVPGPLASDTAVTMYVVVVPGLTTRVSGLVRMFDCTMLSDQVRLQGGVPVSAAWIVVLPPEQIVALPLTVAVATAGNWMYATAMSWSEMRSG